MRIQFDDYGAARTITVKIYHLILGALPTLILCATALAQTASLPPSDDDAENKSSRVLSKPYRIELLVPVNIENYLENYLDIFRAQKRKDLIQEDLYLLTDRAADNAVELLKTLGYFSARADARIDDEGDRYVIYLAVVPGEPVTVESVDIRVKGDIENDEGTMQRVNGAMRGLWQLKKGEPFTQSAWDESKRRILEYISSRSYPTAALTHSLAKVDKEKRTVALEIEIVSGPSYVFGEVTLSDFQRYPKEAIQNRISIVAGKPYLQNELRRMQSDLQGLAYFNGVVVEAIPSEKEPYIVPVEVRVEEAPYNKLDVSLGYSTNDGARIVPKYAFHNIAGRGWIFDSALDLSEKKQGGELGLQFPMRPNGYEYRLLASYHDSEIQGWTSRVGRGGIMRARTEGQIERGIVFEHLREERYNDHGRNDTLQATPLSYRWTKRAVIPPNNPRRGYVIQGEASVAVKGLATDENFVRLYGRGTHYFPVGSRHIALARVELGQTITENPEKVPTDYLFRAGGSGSVRGYDFHSLGIIDHSTTVPGRVLATGSLEYQHLVVKDWRAALFVDYGDAADRWGDWDGKTGVGIGARWLSPVGALGADLAYGIDEGNWRFYFNLGMSF
ncbi:MAG: autotransporter assembly complex protein TamA [Burkholderiales bacterium]|jgi:translocation and assembly module TamA|nr:autotransporter assembly complex protein TamA [Burkholderiales bacterium]